MDALEPEAGVAALNPLAEGHPVAKVEIGDGIEAGLERGEAFGGGFGARKLFMVERDAAVGVGYRHKRLVEPAFLDRAVCALLADRKSVVWGKSVSVSVAIGCRRPT